MKFLEETILLVSVSWMIIYLYGLYASSSVAYHSSLLLIPAVLTLIFISSLYYKLKNKN